MSALELSGWFDADFYRVDLLRATLHDQAIMHLVAALGASHEYHLRRQALRESTETDGLLTFGFRQCNNAIKSLIRPAESMDDVELLRVLTASVLFAAFENLQGQRQAALPHVLHARKLALQLRNARQYAKVYPTRLGAIDPVLSHYEIQLGDSTGDPVPLPHFLTSNPADVLVFESAAAARIALERAIANISNYMLTNVHYDDESDQAEVLGGTKNAYRIWFEQWEKAFTDFLSSSNKYMTRNELNACRLLKAHHISGSLLVTVKNVNNDSSAWSEFTAQFRAIVELVSEVISCVPKRLVATRMPQTAYFSPGMGMTEPLYCVASRCTDAGVREKAKVLMGRLPQNEGVYSAWRVGFIESVLCAAEGRRGASAAQSKDMIVT
ncbi:hypothetical protein LTR78_001615 [Recurvomyces mirabilis]|uniref:Uncharacterized protein n=1 Tax=Recurvomyces mirabilis TaxID=574656 RepID=A0AAE1C4X9_9PEZI|nr:hypothetical protein LTR78_001615 [Recurvomyces mirabilis]KAK5151813.1 hypothetical protein LTS14_008947 [Recurvomyces mirabilis]